MKSGLIIPGRVQAATVPGAFYRGASNGGVTFPRFAVGTGAFAISLWVRPVTSAASKNLIGFGDNPAGNGFYIQTNGSGAVIVAGNSNIYIGASVLTPGTWQHIELNRDGSGNLRLFVDGILDATGTVANSSDYGTAGGDWEVGGTSGSMGQSASMDYIDEVAVLVGDIFHSGTSSFTPETSAYTSAHAKYSSMYALLHFDESAFVDYSTYARTITMVGTAAQDTATFKF